MEFGPWQTAWKRHARFAADGVWDRVLTVLLTDADAAGELDWAVSVDSTIARAHQHATNTTREVSPALIAARGAQLSYPNPLTEPADHGVGRSRGGLTSKIHPLVDGWGRPMVLVVTAGQANDSPVLPALLHGLRVPRVGPGRPRTRPEAVLADKAYSSRAHRQRLRAAGVNAVIPEPADQIAHRRRRGSAGGRPPAFDPARYRDRNVVERNYALMKQWRGRATRDDKHATNHRAAAVLHTVITWFRNLRDTP